VSRGRPLPPCVCGCVVHWWRLVGRVSCPRSPPPPQTHTRASCTYTHALPPRHIHVFVAMQLALGPCFDWGALLPPCRPVPAVDVCSSRGPLGDLSPRTGFFFRTGPGQVRWLPVLSSANDTRLLSLCPPPILLKEGVIGLPRVFAHAQCVHCTPPGCVCVCVCVCEFACVGCGHAVGCRRGGAAASLHP
jgi:hypothetical protein